MSADIIHINARTGDLTGYWQENRESAVRMIENADRALKWLGMQASGQLKLFEEINND